ncbi:MAG: PEP-CTERM sorting domain-containing protein [Verrucomicrobiales bacterium]
MKRLGLIRFTLALAGLAGATGLTQGQPVTVTFSAQEIGSALGVAEGTELPAESLVRFGYFSISFEQVVAGLGTPSLLEDSFIELASTRIGYFGGSTVLDGTGQVLDNFEDPSSPFEEAPGLFGHSLTYDPEAMSLLEARFYLWVVDTPELANASQFGLFSDSGWLTPNTPGEAIYDLSQVDPNDPADLFHADRGLETSSIGGFGPLNKLRPIEGVPVPEPGLPALLLLATAAAAGWRRRPQPLVP